MRKTKLTRYFPMLRTRTEVLEIINRKQHLKTTFLSWNDAEKEQFLSFCTGQRGMKILYDSFFKEVFNPEYSVERLDRLLSVIIGRKVHIIQILPVDSSRMGDEASLVAMDIVVELEDKTVINVEMQKIGYLFPGERSACYSSDLVLRQYKRIRDKSTVFSYKKMKPVYTIVFFEKSPEPFDSFPDDYIHSFEQKSNTGLELELLQKYIFISLDKFSKEVQNITNELDAWLLFLSSDKPEDILFLIENYPWFKPMYETLFNMCQNIEGVMDMFSRELYEMDKNTELLMIDEFSKKVDELKKEVVELEGDIIAKKNIITEKESIITEKDSIIAEKDSIITEKDSIITEKDSIIAEKDSMIVQLKAQLASQM